MDILSALTASIDPLIAVVGNLKTVIESIGNATGSAVSAVGGFVTGLGGAMDAIKGLTNQFGSFAAALSPSTMLAFNRAMLDLQATVGQAVLPIFQVLTGVLRDVAGAINGAMAGLIPVVTQLTQIFASLLLPYVRLFAAMLSAVTPLLQVVADVLEIFADAMQPIFAVAIALTQAFGGLIAMFTQSLQPLLLSFANTMKNATEQLIKFIVMLGKALNANKFVADFIAALHPKDEKGQASATQARISTVSRMNADILQAAFVATGGGGDKAKLSDTDRLIEELKAINPTDSVKAIADDVRKAKDTIVDIYNWAQRQWGALDRVKVHPDKFNNDMNDFWKFMTKLSASARK